MRRRLTLLALTTTALLALTACSGGSGDELDYEDSPLNRYLSVLYSNGFDPDASAEEQQAFWDEQNRRTEELVAECMADEGFEYVPNVANGGMVFSSGDDNPWKPDDREWVEQYGYGMIDWPGREEMNEAPVEEYVDPNQDYVESLSESERQAYYDTLHGTPPDESEIGEDGSYEYRWEDAGCYGWAQHESQGESPWEAEENKPLVEAINDFYTKMQSSAEYEELDAAWASCMADKGHEAFSRQSEAQESINDLVNEYYESASPDEMPDETFGTLDDPEFAAIQEKEVPVALADLECREKTDYRQKQLSIQFALEEQFIADHKQELESLKAAAEQDGS